MIVDKSKITIYCDCCHRKGNSDCPDHAPRWLSQSVTAESKTQARKMGWWCGRLWEFCPDCKEELGLKSREKK